MLRTNWRWARTWTDLLAPITLATGLAFHAVVLFLLARRMWFFNDDWGFLVGRSLTHDPVDALLRPNNGHWSTLPVIAFRLLFHFYGLASYLPYAMMAIAAHLAICVAMYLLLRRAGVVQWVAVLSTLTTAFLAGGAGAQNPLWDFQVGFLGSAFFGLAALLVLDRGGSRAPIVGPGLLVLSLMCSGVGLIMVGWAAAWTLLRRGLRPAALLVAAPLLVYVVWYLAFGRNAESFYPAADPKTAPFDIAFGLGNVWSAASSVDGSGAVILAVLAAAVILPRHSEHLFALGASGLLAVVMAFTLFGYSRSGIDGSTQTGVSRYVYFGILFCCPALTCLIEAVRQRLTDRSPWAVVVVAGAMLAGAVVLGSAESVAFADQMDRVVGGFKDRVVAEGQLLKHHERLLRTKLDPKYNRGLTISRLRPAVDRLPRLSPSPANMLQTRSSLQVGVWSRRMPTPYASSAAVIWGPTRRQNLTSRQCATGFAEAGRIEVPVPPRGAQFTVVVPGTGRVSVTTRLTKSGLSSSPMTHNVVGGTTAHVGSTAPGTVLVVGLPATYATVCLGPMSSALS